MLSANKRLRGNGKGNAAMAGSPVRKRSLKLVLFASGDPPAASAARSPRSPRSFDDGVVGLGIVAAMSGGGGGGDSPQTETPARSEPIPIVSPRPRVSRARDDDEEDEDDELSESYTCVISHVGGGPARKRVYFDDGSDGGGGCGVFYQSPPAAAVMPPAADFLNQCFLCKKKLHGLDIFMYRGEKAFCSVDCRCQQILSDEYREKCGSGALKSFEYSVSPCSAPLFFASRVAAA